MGTKFSGDADTQQGVGANKIAGESERLRVLAEHAPDSLMGDPELQAIASFAARLCATPIALVSLVEEHRQLFLAREGLDESETPRSMSFCQYAMLQREAMEVPDARLDPRFKDTPLVTGNPNIRFYAGMPLHSAEGEPMGSLCVISPEPRDGLTDFQRDGLHVLAQAVMRRLRDRRKTIELSDAARRFEALADAIPQMAWSTDADGKPDYFNRRWYEFTGGKEGDHHGDAWADALHPDDRARAAAVWNDAVRTGEPYEVEYRMLRHDDEYRWTLARGLSMHGADGTVVRWFGTNTDIHEARTMIESKDLLSRELGHRIKNIFSLVSGLIHFAATKTPELGVMAHGLNARVAALGRAHDYIRPDGDSPDGELMQGMLYALVEPYQHDAEDGPPRIEVHGDDVPIRPESATPLALVFHELATNSAKYGALSVPQGKVTIDVAMGPKRLVMRWTERGGPAASDPGGKRGFGSELVELSVARQLRGTIDRDWHEEGLKVTLDLPRDRVCS